MRILLGKVRFGLLFDAVLLIALLVLLIAFLRQRGHSLPRVHITFQSSDDFNDDQHRYDERHLTTAANGSQEKTENVEEDLENPSRERRRTSYGGKGASFQAVIESRMKLLPDVRPSKCRLMKYDVNKLKESTTLIIHFTDYELYDAQVTLSSVLHDDDDTDRQTLAEIIVVDAGSILDHIRNEADDYVESLRNRNDPERHSPAVRLIRMPRKSKSRRWPREDAIKVARTDVVVFLDPGVVVGRGWLAPLIKPLVDSDDDQNGRPSAVESHLDRLRNPVSLEYQQTTDEIVPVPSWSLAIRMRYLPVRDDDGRKVIKDVRPYRSVPVLRGSAFAVRIPDTESIGGLFDDGLEMEGGGEYLELSLRLWMCGSGIKQATCSHVGVPNIDEDVRVILPSNARRITKAWFASRKTLVARFGGHVGIDDASATDAAVAMPDRDKCKDIEWYMKTAAAGSLFAPRNTNSTEFGLLQVQTSRCARIGDDLRTDLDVCDPQPETYFELTNDGRLIATATGRCLTVTNTYYIIAAECKKPVDETQKWEYNSNGELRNEHYGSCATHVTDPDKEQDGRQIMMAQGCRTDDKKLEQFKKWQFILQ